MAEWFRCKPLPLLDALQDLSEDAQLVYLKTLLQIYHRDGRIPANALRSRFPNWRPKRLQRALDELIVTGKLIGTATGELHNDYAMHELQQLAELSQTRADQGAKGGRTRSDRERLAKKIAARNVSPDLFEANPVENGQREEKAHDINARGQAPLKHAGAGTREENHVETPLNRGSTAVQPPFNDGSIDFQIEDSDTNPNDINEHAQAALKHSRASEEESETEEDSPLGAPPMITVAEIELVEGELMDAPPDPRSRKQPIPPGWLPTRAKLSDNVRARVDRWSDDEVDEQAIKFLEWAEAVDARFVHWDRAFGNWCMKHHEQRRTRGGKQSGWTRARAG